MALLFDLVARSPIRLSFQERQSAAHSLGFQTVCQLAGAVQDRKGVHEGIWMTESVLRDDHEGLDFCL
jgi:hypothetical protein